MGSVVSYAIAVHKVFITDPDLFVHYRSRLICSLMMSSVTSRRRLNFHHKKVDFKKSEVVQPLI